MVKNIEDVQKAGKDNVEAALKAFAAWSKGAQSIAVEITDYAKKAFEEGSAAAEKLASAKSIEKVAEVQTEYLKNSYESFVAQAAKLGELYVGLAQEAYKPFEAQVAKAAASK
jgi:hypothetical protein